MAKRKPARPKKKLKREAKPKAAEAPPVSAVVPAPPEPSMIERNVAMFKDWISGSTYKEIAAKYGLSTFQKVYEISVKENWKALRKKYRSKLYSEALDEMKDLVSIISAGLQKDAKRIIARIQREDKDLTKEERDHLRALFDRTLKEVRLEDGKPTDISNAPTRGTIIVLPEGAKRFGILPPDPKVKVISMADQEKPIIDVDAIDIDTVEAQQEEPTATPAPAAPKEESST